MEPAWHGVLKQGTFIALVSLIVFVAAPMHIVIDDIPLQMFPAVFERLSYKLALSSHIY